MNFHDHKFSPEEVTTFMKEYESKKKLFDFLDDLSTVEHCRKVIDAGRAKAMVLSIRQLIDNAREHGVLIHRDENYLKQLYKYSAVLHSEILKTSTDMEDLFAVITYGLSDGIVSSSTDADMRLVKAIYGFVKRNIENMKTEEDMHLLILTFEKMVVKFVEFIEVSLCPTKTRKLFVTALNTIQNYEKRADVYEMVQALLSSYPINMKSRWELCGAFVGLDMDATFFPPEFFEEHVRVQNFFCVEAKACASEQDSATRCSHYILTIACCKDDARLELAAKVIYDCLTSPKKSTRSNVVRSWLARLVRFPASKRCVEMIIDMARADAGVVRREFPFPYRKLQRVTSADIEWKMELNDDPYTIDVLSFYAYLHVFDALAAAGAQYSFTLTAKDEVLLKSLGHYETDIRLLAILVCRKYNLVPDELVTCLTIDLPSASADNVIDALSREFLKKLPPRVHFYYLQAVHSLNEEDANYSKFFPAAKDENIDETISFLDTIRCLEHAETTMENLLAFQAEKDKYLQVPHVMALLEKQKYSERFFAKKVVSVLAYVEQCHGDFGSKKNDICSRILFEAFTRCPLKSVVDFAGERHSNMCMKDRAFAEIMFAKTIELLSAEEENARCLAFELLFVGVLKKDKDPQHKISVIWKTVQNLKEPKRKKMMDSMLSKVVTQWTKIPTTILCEMLFSSMGFGADPTMGHSFQLFAACVGKFLKTTHETDRVALFQTDDRIISTFPLLERMITLLSAQDNKQTIHQAFYFFSRFIYVSDQFYTVAERRVVENVRLWILNALWKHREDVIMVSAGVDAFCSFCPWSSVRDYPDTPSSKYVSISEKFPLPIEELENAEELEKLITKNLTAFLQWKRCFDVLYPDGHAMLQHVVKLKCSDKIIKSLLLIGQHQTLRQFRTTLDEIILTARRAKTFEEVNWAAWNLCLVAQALVTKHPEYYVKKQDFIDLARATLKVIDALATMCDHWTSAEPSLATIPVILGLFESPERTLETRLKLLWLVENSMDLCGYYPFQENIEEK